MKNINYERTSHPDLFRVVDRKGDWDWYVYKPGTADERFLKGVTTRLKGGFTKGYGFLEFLKNTPAEEIERRLQAGGERGDHVHEIVKRLLSGEKNINRATKVLADDNKTEVPMTDEEWDCILAFQEFWNRHDPAVILNDQAVYEFTKAGGYAGTLDFAIRLRKACGVSTCGCDPVIGKAGLWDLKSSPDIYPDYGPQTAAYKEAGSLHAVLCGRAIEYTAILKVGVSKNGKRPVKTGGYSLETYDEKETAKHFREFEAAVLIDRAHNEDKDGNEKIFDPKEDIKDIPDTLSLVITKDELPKPIKKPAKPAKGKRSKPKAPKAA